MTEPRTLGNRYELDEVVGRGGMAEVWRGRDIRLGRIVAVKLLRVDHAGDATFQARFRREAQSAASLNHHNIVAVYDTGEDHLDGHRVPYIVMEYVEGQTLREMLRERARFTPERSIEVIAATLDALEYSHRAGIVHRDIKPGNIMITTAGEVKVMDFGIARSLADTGMALTQTAAVVGTAQYISPEQARGEQADARSDLYATGCVLYELLTGRPPFVGDSLVSVAVSHVREMAPPPSALDPSIPRELDSIGMKSLAKDRRERYQSAYEMRADLQRAEAGLPVAAAADVTSSTQLMGNSAPTAAYAAGQYDDEPMYDDEYDDEDEGSIPVWAVVLGTLAVLAVAGLIGFLLFRNDSVQQISVPNVVGETQSVAEQTLENEGLLSVVETRAVEDEGEVGQVLAQDPPEGTQLAEGESVTITVGAAPDNVTVPNVEGRPRSEAENMLREEGLVPAEEVETEETEDEELGGTVASTSPAIGESVPPDTEVTLTIYQLPDEAQVPNLQGVSLDRAEQLLEDAGLEVGDVSEEASDRPEDEVLRTEPPAFEVVDPGSEVDLVVSSGEPPAIEVPDVSSGRNHNEQSATNVLEEAGFQVDTEEEENCDVPEGIVWTQSPSAGEEHPEGTTVTIGIASCSTGDQDGGDPDGGDPDGGTDTGNDGGNDGGDTDGAIGLP